MFPGRILRGCSLRIFLLVVFEAMLLSGCAERVPLQPQDIAGQLWLRPGADSRVEGFFTDADGRLLLIDRPVLSGVSWAVQDDRLLLAVQDTETGATLTRTYDPAMEGRRLLLVTADSESARGFARSEPGEPQGRKRYRPVYLSGSQAIAEPPGSEPVYLQFDPVEKSIHGFGGVNNFHGRYLRSGVTGFKIGPLASTMMSGPGLDYDLLLQGGLGRADTLLAFDNNLLLYAGSELLIHLQLL